MTNLYNIFQTAPRQTELVLEYVSGDRSLFSDHEWFAVPRSVYEYWTSQSAVRTFCTYGCYWVGIPQQFIQAQAWDFAHA